ncbi:methylated-DNA--[protein]-cysteine S-methyltransferase [Comamonas terrigena]|uniref:methylated-DNA--[protein]-cysteine S-methyltransferase n=2 Tax=Comamonas terrigena TaxID=32013 RepID=UPI0024480136|nr:MGMT family protein [Comamonas terrigena]MDH0050129.1 MGMT family protein [Comamonas terrigena]MDH0512307.1 MGMT family protein [Comamonas terrigena]MDH1091833.1 MGMT family protein [Comamonas terrigena]MDH1502097.1 MGMT family protein [Comamonas terrigena]
MSAAAAAFRVDLADASLGYGHALFATRIGVCAVAWQPQAVLALQLPEVDGQSTRARMLQELAQRLTSADVPPQADWLQAHSAAQMPECALQAVAGVQQLMAGWRAAAGEAEEGEGGESALHWPGAGDAQVLGDLRAGYHPAAAPLPATAAERQALPHLLEIALDWQGVPEFARNVYALARAIAPGQTRTYGDLAADLGGPGLARAVGQALGANPFAPVVPCHRVLAAGREPGGFSGGQGALTKLRMLELEGAAWGGTRSLFE